MYETLAQWAQYNKFVENRLKNQILVNWITVNVDELLV